ncbi:hypothetical protein F2Q69_00059173 [Brassica cretica]|uniref:Uncharacterized protein n=1 Tax=Brassica cretica TaxID=69181 RepID=A0A8S9RJ81_BRACR|nr:hypothetical protein F2Q69_00059173 [Brassica cretica]
MGRRQWKPKTSYFDLTSARADLSPHLGGVPRPTNVGFHGRSDSRICNYYVDFMALSFHKSEPPCTPLLQLVKVILRRTRDNQRRTAISQLALPSTDSTLTLQTLADPGD